MPTKLETFPKLPSQARHDWDLLLDGSIWELKRGEDFDGKPKTFIANARLQARKRGGGVRTRLLEGETVVLQFRGMS
jgi:hypothetical protein